VNFRQKTDRKSQDLVVIKRSGRVTRGIGGGYNRSWVSRGVWFTDFRSICRLNLKFESSAIHTYSLLFMLAVRNAIDDLGFLDQVIGIELSSLGQVTGIALSCLGSWDWSPGCREAYGFLTFPSICRLNLKFGRSAILTY